MSEFLAPDQIEGLIESNSSFIDYKRFEDGAFARKIAKEAFLGGSVYVPQYDYPKLDTLLELNIDNNEGKLNWYLEDKKRATYNAVLELDANRNSGHLSPEIHDLYASFHENRLQKMMLVQAAERMRHADSSSAQLTARNEFMDLNKELYGEMDTTAFEAIMTTEKSRVESFEPKTDLAGRIKSSLEEYFVNKRFETKEEALLDQETMDRFQSIIEERYSHIFEVVPNTSDEQMYNAEQSRDILQSALEAGGLAKEGWSAVVNPSKTAPATNADSRKIFLPSTTSRNATQLKRLIVHEQEAHARRAQNGDNLGIRALRFGTANYADVEEGIGVLLECVVANDLNSPAFNRARDRYIAAGLALGTDGTPKDAANTFNILWKMFAVRNAQDGVITDSDVKTAKEEAYTHVENAFRGTNFAMPGIIYTKLKVYYEGFTKNAQFFRDNIGDLEGALDRAMIGKHDHTNPDEAALVQKLAAGK